MQRGRPASLATANSDKLEYRYQLANRSRFAVEHRPRSCKNLKRMPQIDTAASPALSEFERVTPKQISRAGKLFALACIPLICTAVYYSPVLTSLGWHVIHGKAVEYRGLHVKVPWGWTADLSLMKEDYPANPQGITLQKPPKTLNIEARGPELMYINLLLPDSRSTPQQQAEEWKQLFRQSHPPADFNVAAAANLPANIDCLEASPRKGGEGVLSGVAMACISLQGGWLANYAGTRASTALFRNVMEGLKP